MAFGAIIIGREQNKGDYAPLMGIYEQGGFAPLYSPQARILDVRV
jgi:hypothetical protein